MIMQKGLLALHASPAMGLEGWHPGMAMQGLQRVWAVVSQRPGKGKEARQGRRGRPCLCA